MSQRLTVAFALTLAVAAPAAAQLPLPVHVVPFVAGGAGGELRGMRTDLAVTNLGTQEAVAGVWLFPATAGAAFDAVPAHTVRVAPAATVVVEDVVERWFPGMGGRGWLLVADSTAVDCAAAQRPYPALLAVAARVGYGTRRATPDVIVPSWLSVNATHVPSVLLGLDRADAHGTTELGIANLSTVPIAARVRVRLAGRDLGAARVRLGALGFGSWPMAALGLPRVPAGGVAEVDLPPADNPAADPCAPSPRPCTDPCDTAVCPQRYRLPGFPVFVAFALELDSRSGSLRYVAPIIDHVGALRALTEYKQSACPERNDTGSLIDLFARLSLLRDPAGIPRLPAPTPTVPAPPPQ